MKAVALKVAYNDGGARPGGLIGYRGVCSNPVILDNVKVRRMTNCKEAGGPCRLFADKNFAGPRPSLQIRQPWCYESTLLSHKPWKFGAGVYHRGPKKGKPIPIRNASAGDVAILTTREPGAREGDRFIFAIFRIGQIANDPTSGAMITSDGTLDICLPDDAARMMSFWRYHRANGGPDWRTGLFRYLADDETAALLTELMGALGDCSERDLIYEALGRKMLPRSPGTSNHTNPTCPEGLAHRLLKERVAANPNLIGLPKSAKPTIEYSFLSGDKVDIHFNLLDGSAAVVEIETIIPLPGAHQCIKYRALLEAERGDDLNSGNVKAILVAYGFDAQTRAFAKKYNVKLVELPP